ncbi:hypothetical protein A0H81_12216 [Grifola frondosa]|uniref:Zn(2)-C6 fungal-type domain-containing protein n=1 Tax=Grifola frondosa TaxID=5627 RepID=A0A1C7LTE5_GRIFR|nr:hypothetical protein A0H81_12216 [Grifola frondosa]
MACTNCASACKRCDEARPCERCIKYGISDTCVDGVRKERKKGIKRGPYKRKNRASGGETPSPGFSPPGDAEQQPPPAPYPIQTEGYYPYFYPPPPPGYGPPPPAPDGQAHPEGAPNGTALPFPIRRTIPSIQPYMLPPIGYPPPPVPTPAPAQNAPPSSTAKADQSPAVNVATGDGASTKSKKRARAKSGDEGTRAKKAKEANGDVALGKDQRQLGGPPEHGPAFTGSEPRALVAAV